ncbi:MAG: HEAT repeat domain-containing protein [Planctomycetota bacterium]
MKTKIAFLFMVVCFLLPICSSCSDTADTDASNSKKRTEDKNNLNELINIALTEKSHYKRLVAIEKLGNRKEPEAVDTLVKIMNSDTAPNNRQAAVMQLRRIGDKNVVEPFIAALTSPDNELRRRIAEGLGELKDKCAVEALVNLLKDTESAVRYSAVNALTNMEVTEAVDDIIPLLNDADNPVREIAVKAIKTLNPDKMKSCIETTLKNSSITVRIIAAETLGQIKATEAGKQLISLMEDENSSVKIAAINALAELSFTEAVKPLTALIKDNSIEVVQAATKALSILGGVDSAHYLIELLDHSDVNIRATAMDGLIKLNIKEPSFIEKLKYMAKYEPYGSLREKTQKALEQLAPKAHEQPEKIKPPDDSGDSIDTVPTDDNQKENDNSSNE